jgi:hypothetical protein
MAVMSNFSEKSNKMHIHVFHMEKSFNGGSDRLISFMVFRVFMAGPQNVIVILQ